MGRTGYRHVREGWLVGWLAGLGWLAVVNCSFMIPLEYSVM